jgi:hypothetical protein
VVPGDAPFARLRLAHGDAEALGKGSQGVRGAAILDAAAHDDKGALGAAEQLGGPRDEFGFDGGPPDAPHPLFEHHRGPTEGFGLHVLGQRQRHRARLGGVGEHAHGFGQRA